MKVNKLKKHFLSNDLPLALRVLSEHAHTTHYMVIWWTGILSWLLHVWASSLSLDKAHTMTSLNPLLNAFGYKTFSPYSSLFIVIGNLGPHYVMWCFDPWKGSRHESSFLSMTGVFLNFAGGICETQGKKHHTLTTQRTTFWYFKVQPPIFSIYDFTLQN